MSLKVAGPSDFVSTPSIFESLILKQIVLYCKNIITHLLHVDINLLWYYFWVIGISRDNDVTIVLDLNRISAPVGIFFGELYATYTLGANLLLCKVHKNL